MKTQQWVEPILRALIPLAKQRRWSPWQPLPSWTSDIQRGTQHETITHHHRNARCFDRHTVWPGERDVVKPMIGDKLTPVRLTQQEMRGGEIATGALWI